MVDFKKILWDLFPPYFKELDSYIDNNGQGLLERYINNMGRELNENFYPALINALDTLDPNFQSGKFIPHIAFLLGNPSNIFNNPSDYKKLFYLLIYIYKTKGTIISYEYAFRLIGYSCILIESFSVGLITDSGKKTDNGNYTDAGNNGRVEYQINILDLNGGPITINDELIAKVNNIRALVEPEHMICTGLTSDSAIEGLGFNYTFNFPFSN